MEKFIEHIHVGALGIQDMCTYIILNGSEHGQPLHTNSSMDQMAFVAYWLVHVMYIQASRAVAALFAKQCFKGNSHLYGSCAKTLISIA